MKNKVILLALFSLMLSASSSQCTSTLTKYNDVVKTLEALPGLADAAISGGYNNPYMQKVIEILTHAEHELAQLDSFQAPRRAVALQLRKMIQINNEKKPFTLG